MMNDDSANGRDWLDGIDVAAPCPANWNDMQGDDRCRFCSQCKLHVFDLSAMTRPAAEALVKSRTGAGERLCVRFTRRADGTVLTRDCPVGLRQRLRRTASRLVAMCAAAFAFLGCRTDDPKDGKTPATGATQPEAPPVEPAQWQGEVHVMGDVVEPPEPRMGRIQVDPPTQEPPLEQPKR